MQKITNDTAVLVGARAPEADYHMASQPNTESDDWNSRKQESERKNEEIILQDRGIETGEDMDMAQLSITQDAPENPEIIRQETAATKTQAAFRGYLVSILTFVFSTHPVIPTVCRHSLQLKNG